MSMPLEGIRVIEMGAFMQAPVAASMLGDLGADVIKIEDPRGGDVSRGVERTMGVSMDLKGGRRLFFEHHNRNKRSITVNVKHEKGKEIVYELIKKADVFVHNFRSHAMRRLGMDYQTFSRINPRIIYATASGFGPKGPDSAQTALDLCAQARAGIMTTVGEPDMPPLALSPGIADQMGATTLAYGILAALIARERLGIGQEVEASHLASMIHLQRWDITWRLLLGSEMPKYKRTDQHNPLYNYYRCADGKWLVLAMLQSDRYWPELCKSLGIEDVGKDPKFENMDKREENHEELISILDSHFASKNRDEWVRILKEGDFLFSVVNTTSEVCNDPQALENDYIVDFDHPVLGRIKLVGIPVQLSKTPGSIRTIPPELGEHTEGILVDLLGYSWDRIGELKEEGVI